MPKQFFAYIRVSTSKQGEEGVSLAEQRAAISQYAERNGFLIARWFEECETAAKRGRRVFTELLALLKRGKASGVVIHKIDRGARNMKDWAEIGDLLDSGIDVRFANDNLDLNTRGGRLSADIQAVVAADFIRNLREETKKGFYGRLKQGLYPMPAPLGYQDRGKGTAKAIDPTVGPLVKQAFELYATAQYTLVSLAAELHRRGLRAKTGTPLSDSSLSVVLNNTFYMGLIQIRKTGQTYQGAHVPLVSPTLFRRVQDVLSGRLNAHSITHEFLFRRLFRCGACGYSLIGERQKGHVYYRCQTRTCPTTGVREDTADAAIIATLAPLHFNDRERRHVAWRVEQLRNDADALERQRREALSARLGIVTTRLDRLTDAFLDGTVERFLFEQRKTALLMERQGLLDTLAADRQPVAEQLARILELAGNAYVSYKRALAAEKRELLNLTTSNRQLDGKTPVITLREPFRTLAARFQGDDGSPHRSLPRTWGRLLKKLSAWLVTNAESQLSDRLPLQDSMSAKAVKTAR